MKTTSMLRFALALFVSISVSGAGRLLQAQAAPNNKMVAPSGDAAAKKDILALEDRYNDGFNTRNVNEIMSCYAPGKALFVFDAIPPRQYPSWDAYKRDWETLFSAFPGPVSTTISEQSITVVGSVAYGHNIQSTTFTAKDGSKSKAVVRVTDVYRKLNGKWLIVLEHVSFPVDLTTGKADLLSQP
jgi:ketosteroid isomerase-like protein